MQGNKKLNLRTSQAEKQTMTTNLADITKTDLAAEVDRLQAQINELGIDAHKLEIELTGAQTEIAKLQSEITELAARPCLACALLPAKADKFESELRGALLMLDQVDVEVQPWRSSDAMQFFRDRAELWETFNRLTAAQK